MEEFREFFSAVPDPRALNARHAPGREDAFYLLHRLRRWNPQQGVWMGWERKRGKLAEFNHFLRGGAADAFSTIVGDVRALRGVRYVITLDSDTMLPTDAAIALVGAIPFVGEIVMGIFFIFFIAVAFVLMLLLLGVMGGFHLLYPTIAVEGSDTFDAMSRAFAYVYARPWRLGFYTLVSLFYGVLTFLFVEFFDTAGTLMAVASKAGLLEDNKLKRAGRALLADSSSIVAAAIIGSSPTTAYIESAAGVASGARTGFSTLVVAALFALALFFSPLLAVVTANVTAPALIIEPSHRWMHSTAMLTIMIPDKRPREARTPVRKRVNRRIVAW